MIHYILRGVFILLVATVATLYLLPDPGGGKGNFVHFVTMLAVALGLAVLVIAADIVTPRKKLSAVSGVFLGLLAGLLAAYALSFVVNLIGLFVPAPSGVSEEAFKTLLEGIKVFIGLITCYLGISLVLQTKDDFRFVVPYVEFAREIRGNRPTLMDTSAIIDGRVLDLAETHILQGALIVPRFVLNELQTIADSPDKLRRARGRRGLDVLEKLQDSKAAEVAIDPTDPEGNTVDQMLVALAVQMQARIMTGDFNLMKIAHLRGVEVINLNDVAAAVRPVVLPGEPMTIKIVKAGEAAGQGVGYLDDGTMVVVENTRHRQGDEVDLVVTSMLQTSAGRMIFGKTGESTERRAASGQERTASEAPSPGDKVRQSGPRSARTPGRSPRRRE